MLIATGDRDGHVRLWAADGGELVGETRLGAPVGALDITHDGSVLACGCDDGVVHFLDPFLSSHGPPDLRPPLRLVAEPDPGTDDAADSDTADSDTADSDTAAVAVTALAQGPGGWLVAAGDDGGWRRLEIEPEVRLGPTVRGHDGPLGDVAASLDGVLLATAGWDGTARLWDAATGEPRGDPLVGHTDTVTVCTFSPDAALLATGSWDGSAILWDVTSGRPVPASLDAHTDWVTGCAFGPGGRLLVTTSSDDRIRLWDVATGSCRLTLRTGYPLTCLAVQGALVVVGADRHLLRFRLGEAHRSGMPPDDPPNGQDGTVGTVGTVRTDGPPK
jgi:WD40 repeat protein